VTACHYCRDAATTIAGGYRSVWRKQCGKKYRNIRGNWTSEANAVELNKVPCLLSGEWVGVQKLGECVRITKRGPFILNKELS
jgi:hypothetical protein